MTVLSLFPSRQTLGGQIHFFKSPRPLFRPFFTTTLCYLRPETGYVPPCDRDGRLLESDQIYRGMVGKCLYHNGSWRMHDSLVSVLGVSTPVLGIPRR